MVKKNKRESIGRESIGSRMIANMGFLDESKHCIFKPDIKDDKCKHKWQKLTMKAQGGIFGGRKLEYEYLFCTKCNSVTGDEIWV